MRLLWGYFCWRTHNRLSICLRLSVLVWLHFLCWFEIIVRFMNILTYNTVFNFFTEIGMALYRRWLQNVPSQRQRRGNCLLNNLNFLVKLMLLKNVWKFSFESIKLTICTSCFSLFPITTPRNCILSVINCFDEFYWTKTKFISVIF